MPLSLLPEALQDRINVLERFVDLGSLFGSWKATARLARCHSVPFHDYKSHISEIFKIKYSMDRKQPVLRHHLVMFLQFVLQEVVS